MTANWMIGLSVVCGLLVPVALFLVLASIPGNPGPNHPMLKLPYAFLAGAAVLAIACVGGLAFGLGWLAPHGYWRGEAFLLLPILFVLLASALFAGSMLLRLSLFACAALVIWLSA